MSDIYDQQAKDILAVSGHMAVGDLLALAMRQAASHARIECNQEINHWRKRATDAATIIANVQRALDGGKR